MKEKEYDFDTSELLSSLDKLKAKYSFNLDDSEKAKEDTPPEAPRKEAEENPVESAESFERAEAFEPVETEESFDKIIPESETPWFIDSNEPTQQLPDQPIIVSEFDDEPVFEEAEPVIEAIPEAEKESGVAWYLDSQEPVEEAEDSFDELFEEESIDEFEDISSYSPEAEAEAEAFQDEPAEPEEIPQEPVQQETPSPSIGVFFDDDEDDEFADLDDDDDLLVIGIGSPVEENSESVQEPVTGEEEEPVTAVLPEQPAPTEPEVSPFYAAFIENSNPQEKQQKAPKPVKSPKPAKPVKEPKEKKVKKETSSKKSNSKKKLILNVVVGVALVVAIWASLFITDILLVSNWSAPVFSGVSDSYEDGSKTYMGLFYQIQISVDDDGKIQRVVLPWFAKGPNGEK